MAMNIATVVGIVAGTLTTVAYVPQVIKTWKTKSTKDLSLGMFITLSTGIFLWAVYGFLIGSLPVILANAVTLLLSSFVMILKIRYR